MTKSFFADFFNRFLNFFSLSAQGMVASEKMLVQHIQHVITPFNPVIMENAVEEVVVVVVIKRI